MDIEFVRYCRPKSSAFGNSVKKRDLEKGWEMTQNFLDKHTEYCLSNSAIVDPYWNTTRDGLGLPELVKRKIAKFDNPNNIRLGVYLPLNFRWKMVPDKVLNDYSQVFEYFLKGENGFFGVYLKAPVFIQPEFIIPYPPSSSECKEMINELKLDLPFKVSDNSLICFKSRKLKNGKITYKAMGQYED
ncbi:hypothetical protein [uncultured Shewanella sp.]|uniref:hypothetical protein n=1 Tax=Shewanella atlantica TaxID=271099 RepID=UPI002611B5A5|nr:hypothetical protein [uncultured Shewanella sp.]